MEGVLSEDVTILRARLAEALDALAKRDKEIAELSSRIQDLLRRLFGRKSERMDPAQLALAFMELDRILEEESAEEDADDTPDEESEREGRKKKGSRRNGRVPLPPDLPRERVEVDPDPESLVCPCCNGQKVRFGEEVTEELEYRPASFLVKEIVRGKYACPDCEAEVTIADPPARPIEKGRPGPGLLAHVVVSKYGDHLPLYRQTQMYRRHGVSIPRATLCDWVRDAADLLLPIVLAMKREILATGYVNTDDTPVRVHMGKGGPGRTKEGRIWVYVSPELREAVYDFTMSRSGEGPAAYLDGFRGYLQADAFSGYDRLFVDGEIVEVGCNAHSRRKYYEALESSPEEATLVLAIYRALYDIEVNAKERGITGAALADLRTEMACPLIDALRKLLESEQEHALPKSPLGKAIGYTLNHFEALKRYVEDGRLSIDNGEAERALRTVGIGRKNWIFCGSPAGGRRAAILYSLTTSCKLQGIDPFEYMRDVLSRLYTTPESRIGELTPRGWRLAREAAAAANS